MPETDKHPGYPRRIMIQCFTPAELAIHNAKQWVEMAGCDPLLTDALILLEQAQNKVADFVDQKQSETHE